MKTIILGAGLTGLSASYHIGHENCLILEKGGAPYGHIRSEVREGFTWDQGPHVSFTKNEYVRELFAESVLGDLEEYPVRTRNFYRGYWIDHPAQSNLFQVPEPLRSECLRSFFAARESRPPSSPQNYLEWLNYAFGPVFAATFSSVYTKKYWTVEPKEMGTDWIGRRVFYPTVEDVIAGASAPLPEQTHYITHVRYPSRGGYEAFARKLRAGGNVHLNTEVVAIDLRSKRVSFQRSGSSTVHSLGYDRLINTIPLSDFVSLCAGVPPDVRNAAKSLNCSQLLLVNITAPHGTQVDGNWFYIYNEDFHSTRINCTERLSPHNAPFGHTGVQVEVYAHPKNGISHSHDDIAKAVVAECAEMGFVDKTLALASLDSQLACTGDVRWHTQYIPYANVICDHERKPALDVILNWLASYGLERDDSDLAPYTDWERSAAGGAGTILLAGRFGQWKYFWTDDCVLRGKQLRL